MSHLSTSSKGLFSVAVIAMTGIVCVLLMIMDNVSLNTNAGLGAIGFTIMNTLYSSLLLFVINAYLNAFSTIARESIENTSGRIDIQKFENMIETYQMLNNGLGRPKCNITKYI